MGFKVSTIAIIQMANIWKTTNDEVVLEEKGDLRNALK